MAASFPPGSNYINTNAGACFQNQTEGTICAWFNLDSPPSLQGALVHFSTPAGTNRFNFEITSGALSCLFRRLDSDGLGVVSGGTVIAGWNSGVIVARWAAGDLKIYLNGALVATAFPGGWAGPTSNTSSLNARIGSGSGAGFQFAGRAHDVRTYRRAWTAAEASAFHSAKGADRIRNGLYNRWILNNGISGGVIGASAVRDYGPGQNHGSGVNNPTWVGAPLRTRPKAI